MSSEWLNQLLLCFIPLFVAMDVYGIVPLYLSMTEGYSQQQKNHLVTQATLTCFAIAVLFLALGNLVFSFLGITEADFRIGGGLLLLIFAITDLLFSDGSDKRRSESDGGMGVVPIGIPLIMGPAAMTTILILMDSHGIVLTLISVILNLAIVWVSFRQSHWVVRLIGRSGSKAVAKVAALFLAGIGVMMIRVGVLQIVEFASG